MKTPTKMEEAVDLITDGSSILFGGFMGVGSPHRLIAALSEAGKKDLTVIGNDAGRPNFGIAKLISAGAVTKVIASHIGLNPELQQKMISGEIEVDLVPQGTLAERIRAGGFGLGGVLTATGLGTPVEEGKQKVDVDGQTFLLEKPIRADFAIIGAQCVDYVGNLQYSLTAHNFNPVMCMAADTVIVEAGEIVPVGVIPPDSVKTPGILVHHILERAA